MCLGATNLARFGWICRWPPSLVQSGQKAARLLVADLAFSSFIFCTVCTKPINSGYSAFLDCGKQLVNAVVQQLQQDRHLKGCAEYDSLVAVDKLWIRTAWPLWSGSLHWLAPLLA